MYTTQQLRNKDHQYGDADHICEHRLVQIYSLALWLLDSTSHKCPWLTSFFFWCFSQGEIGVDFFLHLCCDITLNEYVEQAQMCHGNFMLYNEQILEV